MFGWRMRLLLAAVLAGVTGLIWLQGLEFVDAQGADPLQRGYMTVVVADDLSDADNPATSLTIDFHTTIACSRGDYNAYISNVIDFIDGIPKRHLGSAALRFLSREHSTVSGPMAASSSLLTLR